MFDGERSRPPCNLVGVADVRTIAGMGAGASPAPTKGIIFGDRGGRLDQQAVSG